MFLKKTVKSNATLDAVSIAKFHLTETTCVRQSGLTKTILHLHHRTSTLVYGPIHMYMDQYTLWTSTHYKTVQMYMLDCIVNGLRY